MNRIRLVLGVLCVYSHTYNSLPNGFGRNNKSLLRKTDYSLGLRQTTFVNIFWCNKTIYKFVCAIAASYCLFVIDSYGNWPHFQAKKWQCNPTWLGPSIHQGATSKGNIHTEFLIHVIGLRTMSTLMPLTEIYLFSETFVWRNVSGVHNEHYNKFLHKCVEKEPRRC